MLARTRVARSAKARGTGPRSVWTDSGKYRSAGLPGTLERKETRRSAPVEPQRTGPKLGLGSPANRPEAVRGDDWQWAARRAVPRELGNAQQSVGPRG